MTASSSTDTHKFGEAGGKLSERSDIILMVDEAYRTLLKYKLHTDQELFDKAYAYIRQYYRSGTIAPVRDGTLSTRCGVSIPGEPEMIEPRCSAEHVDEDRQGEKRDATPQQ